jgi:hypothetical protein
MAGDPHGYNLGDSRSNEISGRCSPEIVEQFSFESSFPTSCFPRFIIPAYLSPVSVKHIGAIEPAVYKKAPEDCFELLVQIVDPSFSGFRLSRIEPDHALAEIYLIPG